MKTAGWLIAGLLGAGCASRAEGADQPWRRPVLVELFTSQGCSSCPPADRFVRELPQLGLGPDRVVPLTFHVDYWDELGWKDPFASREFTARQRWYAESGRLHGPEKGSGLGGMYTPQMVVDGQVHFSGQRRELALAEMRRAAAAAARVRLTPHVTVVGDRIDATVEVAALFPFAIDDTWRLRVVLAARSARTPVLAGENGGETLEEAAVVRVLSEPLVVPPPPARSSVSTAHLTLRRPPAIPAAALELVTFLQSTRTLEVAGVAAVESLAP